MTDGHALVVLPSGADGIVADARSRRWLSRGNVSLQAREGEMLASVLTVIGAPMPKDGLAALRLWGQSGDRPDGWIAAADPVHLQARLTDLRIRALLPEQVSANDVRRLFDTLQAELATSGQFRFSEVGAYGYLHSVQLFDMPSVSAETADGHVPDMFTPSGDVGKTFHQLLGEVQMLLHEHAVNCERQNSGLPVINSLWLWGGGSAPLPVEIPLPDLYSDDPLFQGYWARCAARAEPWQAIGDCLNASHREFVVVMPNGSRDTTGATLAASLSEIEHHVKRGNIRRLTLLFREGLTIAFGKFDRLKFWRGSSPLFEETNRD